MIITPESITPPVYLKKEGKMLSPYMLMVEAVLVTGDTLKSFVDYVNTDSKIIGAQDEGENNNILCVERYQTIDRHNKIRGKYTSISIKYYTNNSTIVFDPDNLNTEFFTLANIPPMSWETTAFDDNN